MSRDELSGPDLAGVVADANAVGLEHVVIGGFSVIYHGYIRATKDSDLLVSDEPTTDAAIVRFLDRADSRPRQLRLLGLGLAGGAPVGGAVVVALAPGEDRGGADAAGEAGAFVDPGAGAAVTVVGAALGA